MVKHLFSAQVLGLMSGTTKEMRATEKGKARPPSPFPSASYCYKEPLRMPAACVPGGSVGGPSPSLLMARGSPGWEPPFPSCAQALQVGRDRGSQQVLLPSGCRASSQGSGLSEPEKLHLPGACGSPFILDRWPSTYCGPSLCLIPS